MASQHKISESFLDVMISFFKYLAYKLSHGLFELLIIIGTFFAPAAPVLLAVGMAIAVDTYFGRWKVKHLEGRQALSSKKMRIGLIPKSVGYSLVVASFYLLDWAIINEFVHLFLPIDYVVTKLVGLTLIYVEYTSMDESYYEVKGLRIKDAFANMIKTIRSFLSDVSKVKEDIDKLKKDKDGRTD